MRIHQQKCPHATLPADRVGRLTIDGTDTIIFSRKEYAVKVEDYLRLHLVNVWIVSLWETTRLRRFLAAIPALWKFCR